MFLHDHLISALKRRDLHGSARNEKTKNKKNTNRDKRKMVAKRAVVRLAGKRQTDTGLYPRCNGNAPCIVLICSGGKQTTSLKVYDKIYALEINREVFFLDFFFRLSCVAIGSYSTPLLSSVPLVSAGKENLGSAGLDFRVSTVQECLR